MHYRHTRRISACVATILRFFSKAWWPPLTCATLAGMPFSPTILHRDDDCVVADKPSGMIVHRGWANDENDLMRAVRNAVGRHVHPLHRLDRGASGAVAFALHPDAARIVGAAFAEGRVEKRYVALTRGHPPEHGVVDHPIQNEPDGPRVPAVTGFTRLGVAGRYALVRAVPRTGRLHQIRRHLKHLACPLIGDVRYGKGEHNRLFRDEYGLHRLALHATLLAFEHPATGERVVVRVPVSGTFRSCLAALGLLEAADADCEDAVVSTARN